jgi:hypothetical protein
MPQELSLFEALSLLADDDSATIGGKENDDDCFEGVLEEAAWCRIGEKTATDGDFPITND